MNIIDNIISRVEKSNIKIVLPEYMDYRVMKAASAVLEKHLCDIIIIGNKK